MLVIDIHMLDALYYIHAIVSDKFFYFIYRTAHYTLKSKKVDIYMYNTDVKCIPYHWSGKLRHLDKEDTIGWSKSVNIMYILLDY